MSGCISGGWTAFLYQTNLYRFQPFRHSFCSGLFSIFCPTKPAITLGMYTIIDVILFCQFSSQFYLNSFQTFGFSACAWLLSVLHPVLPAIALYMCTVLNITGYIWYMYTDFDCFQTLGLAHSSRNVPISYFCLPAITLHMRIVGHHSVCRLIWLFPVTRSCLSFLYQSGIQSQNTFPIAGGSRRLTILRPIHPAPIFYIYSVINIILWA